MEEEEEDWREGDEKAFPKDMAVKECNEGGAGGRKGLREGGREGGREADNR